LPPGPEKAQFSPLLLNAEVYLKGFLSDPKASSFPPIFTESLERRDQEKGEHWRRLGEEARSQD